MILSNEVALFEILGILEVDSLLVTKLLLRDFTHLGVVIVALI